MKKVFFLRFLCLMMLICCGFSVAGAYSGSYTCANKTGGSLTTSSNVSGSSLSWTYTNASWNSPQTRFTANGTIVFAISGIKVTKIELGFSSETYVGSWSGSVGSCTSSGSTVTWEGEATESLTLTTSSAARLKTINFTYEKADGGNTGGGDTGGGETGDDTNKVTWIAKNATDNPGTGNEWTSSNIDSYTSWTATGGNYPPKYYSTGEGLRVYNNGTFSISSTKKIESITLTFSGAGYTFSESETDVTQTVYPNATSYSWDVSRSCRLQKIEITYAEDAPPAELTAPTITTQPVGATYTRLATSVTPLSVAATGNPAPTYQWYSNTSESTTGGQAIDGATSATYIPSVAAAGTTYYYCVASNSQGSAQSEIVAVVVNPITYTVTYNANGGSGEMVDASSPYEENSTVTVLPITFTREGYTFAGWKDQDDTDVAGSFTITANTVLTAQWTKNPITVTLNAGAGSVDQTSLTEATGGAGVTLPTPTISVTGWEFAGWSTASCTETTTAPATLIPTGNYVPETALTLFAVYKKTEAGGGSTTYTLTNAEIVTARTDAGNPSGYKNTNTIASTSGEWSGYFAFNNTSGVISVQINKNNNNYHFASPEFSAGVTSVKIDTQNTSNASTANGRKFYICSSNSTAQPTSGDLGEGALTKAKGDVEISVSGAPHKFYIYSDGAAYINNIVVTTGGGSTTTYNSNPEAVAVVDVTGVTLSETEKVLTVGDTFTLTATVLPDNATNKNVTWTSSNDLVATVSTTGVVTAVAKGNATITATTEDGGKIASCAVTVKGPSYTVTYNANGGSGEMVDTSSPYEEGTTVTVLPNIFTRDGYTFAGWKDQNGTDVADSFTISANTTLYAQWTVNTYTVTWKVNGEAWAPEGTVTTVNHGEKPTLPTAPTAGDFDQIHAFVGWTTATSVSGNTAPAGLFATSSEAPDITANGIVFNAVFAQKTSSSSLYETVGFESTEGYTSNTTYDSATYKTGTQGSKWTINYGAFAASGAIDGSMSAQFRIYSSGGGFGQLRNTVAYADDVTNVAFNAKASNAAGKVKVSWSATGSSYNDIETIDLTNNIETYSVNVPAGAKYIQFTAAGDRPSSDKYSIYIDNVAITCGTVAYADYMITASTAIRSISVDASAAKTEYAIGERLNVDGVVVTATYDDESTRTISSGLTFSPAAGTVLSTPGEQTVTVTYGGVTNSYTVNVKCRLTFDANGGEGAIDPALYADGTQATLPAGDGLSKEHYHFIGWNTAADGSGTTYVPGSDSFTITANTTLYAQWAINTYTVTYNANGGSGSLVDTHSPYNANDWVSVLDNTFTRTGYNFDSWTTEADGSGDRYYADDSFLITGNITLYAQWTLPGENFTIFHEGFGNNPDSARNWNDTYKEQSGVHKVYENATYTVTNAKQTKNNVGSSKSGLMQSPSGSNAEFIVGPLDLSDYADGTDVTLSYKWKAASVKANYSTNVYYATSQGGLYTEIPNSAEGATTFVNVEVDVPTDALVSTAYFKVVFSTSNAQAVIDEFDLSGKQSKAVPNAYFDLPVHFIYAGNEIDIPEHHSLSQGKVTHVSADSDVAAINETSISGGATHGTSTVVTATIAETDEHASATASYMVKIVPQTVTIDINDFYTPFSSPYHLDLSSCTDLKVYVVTRFAPGQNVDGRLCAVVEEVASKVVPAKNGVILEGTPGTTYEVPVLTEADPIDKTNYLVGALKGTTIPVSDLIFDRYTFDSPSGTYLHLTAASAGAPGIHYAPARNAAVASEDTAYLEVPYDEAGELADSVPLGFESNGGTVTGVENVLAGQDTDADGTLYNVRGQRVSKTYHGVILRNGQKYLNK